MDGSIMRRNRTRVYLYMTAMMMILGVLGALLSRAFHWGLTGTGVFLLMGAVMNVAAYFFSDTLIMRASRARPLSNEQAPELHAMVRELAQAGGIPLPRVYLIEDSSMNAFATGRDPRHAAVAVTRGLLEKLTPAEVRGVVAHEMAHVRNWDTLLMTVMAVLAGLISILADVYWRSTIVSKAGEKDRSGAVAFISLALAVFAPLAALLIQLAVSRRREFIADAAGAGMAHDASSLASALQKIGRDRRPLPGMNAATAHLYFSNPMKAGGLVDRLFSTHPPIEERIDRLRQLRT